MPEREQQKKIKTKTKVAATIAGLAALGTGTGYGINYLQQPTISEYGWSVQLAPNRNYKELPNDKSLSTENDTSLPMAYEDQDDSESFIIISGTKQEKKYRDTHYGAEAADETGLSLLEEYYDDGQEDVEYRNNETAIKVTVYGEPNILEEAFDGNRLDNDLKRDDFLVKENKNTHPVLVFKSEAGDTIFAKVTKTTDKEGYTDFNLTRVEPVG